MTQSHPYKLNVDEMIFKVSVNTGRTLEHLVDQSYSSNGVSARYMVFYWKEKGLYVYYLIFGSLKYENQKL